MILTQRNMRSAVDHALNGLYKKFGIRDKGADSAATDDEMKNITVFDARSNLLVTSSYMTEYHSMGMRCDMAEDKMFVLCMSSRHDKETVRPRGKTIANLEGAVIMRWTSGTPPAFVVLIKDQTDE